MGNKAEIILSRSDYFDPPEQNKVVGPTLYVDLNCLKEVLRSEAMRNQTDSERKGRGDASCFLVERHLQVGKAMWGGWRDS